jgi:hypothetical protein
MAANNTIYWRLGPPRNVQKFKKKKKKATIHPTNTITPPTLLHSPSLHPFFVNKKHNNKTPKKTQEPYFVFLT